MGKLFSPRVSQNFTEAFLSTVDRLAKEKQQRDEFNQRLQFRNRQLDFLNVYRESIIRQAGERIEETGEQNDIRNDLNALKFGELQGQNDITNDLNERKFAEKQKQNRIGNAFDIAKGQDKTPFYDLSKSGDSFREFKNLQSGTPLVVDKGKEGRFNVTLNNKLTEVSQSEIEELKSQKIREIEDNTDNEARKINSTVPGFFDAYQSFLSILKKNPEGINSLVSKTLKGMSSTTIDAMKTLLRRRIFE